MHNHRSLATLIICLLLPLLAACGDSEPPPTPTLQPAPVPTLTPSRPASDIQSLRADVLQKQKALSKTQFPAYLNSLAGVTVTRSTGWVTQMTPSKSAKPGNFNDISISLTGPAADPKNPPSPDVVLVDALKTDEVGSVIPGDPYHTQVAFAGIVQSVSCQDSPPGCTFTLSNGKIKSAK